MPDNLYYACREFLQNKHTTLWADYDLTQPDRFEKAVDWLYEQVQGVHSHV